MSVDDFRARILARQPLCLRGGGSKDFYGGSPQGDVLDTRSHTGIVSYEPTELVITARAGTPLAEIETVLRAKHQTLACEPPDFGGAATLGGAVASGLSGPRRAASGSLRDFVLGIKLMDGEGRVQSFGGQVMKNVAGFDVSRLMVGSLGTLGLILEVSLKILPQPPAEQSRRFEMVLDEALATMNRWAGQAWPIAATCWLDGLLTVRLAGARAAVDAASAALGGEAVEASVADEFWRSLRHQRHAFFAGEETLWRWSLPQTAPPISQAGALLVEWGGAERWQRGELDVTEMRALASRLGGHLTRFRGGAPAIEPFQPLSPPLMAVQQRLKNVFDPHRLFNRGRLFPDW